MICAILEKLCGKIASHLQTTVHFRTATGAIAFYKHTDKLKNGLWVSNRPILGDISYLEKLLQIWTKFWAYFPITPSKNGWAMLKTHLFFV